MHVGRGLYYSSYKSPRILVWSIGVIILILMMAIAFLGYIIDSPKWSKFKYNTYKQNKINLTQINIRNRNKLKNNFIWGMGIKRYNSTLIPFENYSKELIKFLKENKLNPIYSYESLNLDSTKKKILFETRGLSGIYLILNKVTFDYYIGSASNNKIYARFSNHLLNFNGSKIVKLAVKKYKLSEFSFLVLELFPEIVNKDNNKNLLELEDFYLKSLLPNYNILTEAGSNFGYKHTEITRLKMNINHSLERRMQIGNLNQNNYLSKETIEKIRENALVKNKLIYSNKTIKNMKKKSKSILLYNLDYTIYGEYPRMIEGANAIGISVKL
jgi:group I intron endonuclease